MTLDEAIKHCEEVMMENLEKTKDRNASDPIAINCFECADEHRQLAEWLKELKAYKVGESRSEIPNTCGDAISRQAVIDILKDKWNMFSNANDAMQESIDTIEAIPSVTPEQKTGRWVIKDGKEQGYDIAGVKTWYIQIMCEKCGFIKTAIEGHIGEYKFCPKCGAKMESPQNLKYADNDTMMPAT